MSYGEKRVFAKNFGTSHSKNVGSSSVWNAQLSIVLYVHYYFSVVKLLREEDGVGIQPAVC